MRHNRRTRRFGRNLSERRAMLENLVTSLIKYQEIKTTLEKAKEAKRLADHVITLGKKDSVVARRQVFSYLQNHELTSKVFKEVAPRFKSRSGGYTRILQLQRRKGDGAQLALLEWTEKEIKIKEPKKTKGREVVDKKGRSVQETHDTGAAHKHEHEEHAHPKHSETKPGKPKAGFFKNLSRFFKNKGGG